MARTSRSKVRRWWWITSGFEATDLALSRPMGRNFFDALNLFTKTPLLQPR
jgi:hypothetical protein